MPLPLSLMPTDPAPDLMLPDDPANPQQAPDGIVPKGGLAHGLLDAPDTETRESDGGPAGLLHAIAKADDSGLTDHVANGGEPESFGEQSETPDVPVNVTDPLARKALETMYGASFPVLKQDPQDADWTAWAKERWSVHGPGVQPRLHLVERNRLMRRGTQWISAQGVNGPWREPPKPRESARVVDNRIGPALDQRVQIVSEQRPGFRTKPQGRDQQVLKRAEAMQVALEYQYDAQKMAAKQKEAAYWNGTDGVAFWHSFWNPDKGPWEEVASGQRPAGDCDTATLRIEQVRVSANASATQEPTYWVVREVIPTVQAVSEYGAEAADVPSEGSNADYTNQMPSGRSGTTSTTPDALYKDQPTVDKYTVYCAKSEYLPGGLMLVTVGNVVAVQPMPLPFGVIPLVRVSDGSTDPNFFSAAIMEDWIDPQMRINALKSKWVDSIRVNAGGRFLGRENTIASETFLGGMTSVIGVKGPGALADSIMPVAGFSIGQDVKDLLELEIKAFEDKSGYNDTSRGSFSDGESGRAILATREALERIFAPPVNAMADAMTQWAEIQLAIMRTHYDSPRILAIEGKGRPDLAQAISGEDLDGVANVIIDPETMMPMPRALKLFLLDSLLQRGLISPDNYMRRMPFAFTQNLDSPDQDQSERAYRVVQAIRESANPQALPMLPQDNEAVHQDVLERELILPDDPTDVPPPVRQAAMERWQMLAMQAQQKLMATMPPPQASPPGHPNHHDAPHGPPHHGGGPSHIHGPTHPQLPPQQQPFGAQNPSIAAGTAQQMGANDAQGGAQQFDLATNQS